MGKIYVLDEGSFRKVGKTSDFKSRKKSLSNEYKITNFKNEWVSSETNNFDAAECIAHSILHKSKISGEKFSASFDDCVKACMSAVARSEAQKVVGNICGLDIVVDESSGFINATKFIKQMDKPIAIHQFLRNDSVRFLNQQIIDTTGEPTFFSTRGRSSATFVHPLIFVELNRHLTARHKVQVYLWLLNEMPNIPSIRKCLDKAFSGSDCPETYIKAVK